MARGHVLLALVTGMTPAEIIFGTLAARVLAVLWSVACVIPVLFLTAELTGIPTSLLVRLELSVGVSGRWSGVLLVAAMVLVQGAAVTSLEKDINLKLGVASASPLLGIGLLTTLIVHASPPEWPVRTGWVLFWIFTFSAVALGLLWATLVSFDRCVGRIGVPRRNDAIHLAVSFK